MLVVLGPKSVFQETKYHVMLVTTTLGSKVLCPWYMKEMTMRRASRYTMNSTHFRFFALFGNTANETIFVVLASYYDPAFKYFSETHKKWYRE